MDGVDKKKAAAKAALLLTASYLQRQFREDSCQEADRRQARDPDRMAVGRD
jgi:hypothetical protein